MCACCTNKRIEVWCLGTDSRTTNLFRRHCADFSEPLLYACGELYGMKLIEDVKTNRLSLCSQTHVAAPLFSDDC